MNNLADLQQRTGDTKTKVKKKLNCDLLLDWFIK